MKETRMDVRTQANKARELLGLAMQPVAIAFRASSPAGIQRVHTSGPSSCSYWKLAAEGEIFYTESSDHLGCTIGAYTHGVEMPPGKVKELENIVGEMVKLQYIRMEEVPDIPRREDRFRVALYAPLAEAPFDPDVVVLRGNAKQIMLLSEAAKAANAGYELSAMGRPTCAMLAAAMKSTYGALSVGCIGNRVYTQLEDDELYFTIPGTRAVDVIKKLETIFLANRELEIFHREKCDRGS
jgi:uncharacterized protein (DUF169 family)